jgi:prenyltransferase beta subunit
MIKRSAFEEVGGYNPDRYVEDFDLWVRLFLAGKSAVVIPQKLLKYRRTPTQYSAEESPNRQIAYYNMLLTVKDYIKKIVCVENPTIVNQVFCDSIAAFFLRYQTKYGIEQRPDLDVADLLFFRKAFQKKFSHINNSLIALDRRIVASAGSIIRDKRCDLLLRLRLLRLFIVGKLTIYHHDGSVIKGAVREFYKTNRRLGGRIYRYLLKHTKSHISSFKLSRRYAIEKKRLPLDVDVISRETLTFIEKMRCKPAGHAHGDKWDYYFSASGQKPILYASVFSVLTYSLYGLLEKMEPDTKKQWAEFIKSYQSDDGLFRDPVIDCSLANTCSWWGWEHLTLHALMALTALGQTATKELTFVKKFYNPAFLTRWLDTRNWDTEPANVSNEVQNVGVALQYARDFHQDSYAQKALDVMFEWLDSHQNSENGSWGNYQSILDYKGRLSQIAQTGYHIWLLYFYDNRPLKYSSQIIDLLLQTQNKTGGFGVSLNSSACEDIDSIDPLIRLMNITDYRKEDILKALERALPWVLVNRNSDGGWVFRRSEPAQIGPKEGWSAKVDESAMFPTWFRTLTLAYLSRALPDAFTVQNDFYFIKCPGHEFL